MKNSFDGLLRALCSECYNYRDGSIRIPKTAAGYTLSEYSKPIITDLMKLIFNTDFMRVDTRLYYGDKIKTYASIVNAVEGCAKNLSTVRSRIWQDSGKLKKALGSDAMEIIIRGSDLAILERYGTIIKGLLQHNEGKTLISGFVFKVCEGDGVSNDLDDGAYQRLVEIAKVYSKLAVHTAKNSVTPEMVAYMEYLDQNKPRLGGIEKERFDELKSILVDSKL